MVSSRVSIISSVRNGEKFLKVAIDSVLKQSFNNFEWIIVDDASTDSTSNILKQYQKKDSRIKVLKNEKQSGLTKSLNFALSKANGTYIARIDHDDIWLPNKLECQIEFLSKHQEIMLLGTNFALINDAGEITRAKGSLNIFSNDEVRSFLNKNNPFCHSSVIFHRDVYKKLGGYNEKFRYGQDYEYWTRIALFYKIHILPEVLCHYRVSENNISKKKKRPQMWSGVRVKYFWIKNTKKNIWEYRHLAIDILRTIIPRFLVRLFRK